MSDFITNYKNSSGTDLGKLFVDNGYMIDRYPELVDTFKQAGLWVWGNNYSGGLGDNTNNNKKSSPIQTVAGGTNWKQISGKDMGVGIKTDGTLWTWGYNAEGELGNNTGGGGTNKSSPVQTVAGGTNWKQVNCGGGTVGAIKTDGTLWLWGDGFWGQLGNNTNSITKSSPVQTVSAGTTWKQVACGNGMTAAVKTDGTLWTWGINSNGELGDNTVANKSSPVQTVAAGTNWKQVAVGSGSMAAIKTDGTLWCWGRNTLGQLGDNTNTNSKSSPVQTVAGGTNWKQVSAGYQICGAIKTDGTLWLWGRNNYGQLGDNTIINKSSPVQTIAAGTTWKQVGCGDLTLAIKTDGTLWTWGRNDSGQLGDNTIATKSSPIQTVAGGTNWKQVAIPPGVVVAAIRDDSSDLFT